MTGSPEPRVAGPRSFTLEELQMAASSLRMGEFRGPSAPVRSSISNESPLARPQRASADRAIWTPQPDERVVAVVGAAGSSGASTLALGLGMAATTESTPPGISVRVVECCSAHASGLAAASDAELGPTRSGWQQGRRDGVQIQRADHLVACLDEVPTPPSATGPGPQLTILDVGWDPCHLTGTDSWVRTSVACSKHVVLTATATVPGLRRLQTAAQMLSEALPSEEGSPLVDRLWLAILGPRRPKWPRGAESAGGPLIAQLISTGRSIEVPMDRVLASRGLDSRPLPDPVLAAVAGLHRQWHFGDGPVPTPMTRPSASGRQPRRFR